MNISIASTKLRLLFLSILIATLTNCGYSFTGSGTVLPPDVRRVYIPMVENDTTETGLTQIVTESLRDQFEKFGVITITESLEGSDAVLNVRIDRLRRNTSTSTSNTNTALQMRTTLTLSGELRRVSGPVMWKNPRVAVSRDFGTSSNVVVTTSASFASSNLTSNNLSSLNSREVARSQEREALIFLSEEAARRIYNESVAPDF